MYSLLLLQSAHKENSEFEFNFGAAQKQATDFRSSFRCLDTYAPWLFPLNLLFRLLAQFRLYFFFFSVAHLLFLLEPY